MSQGSLTFAVGAADSERFARLSGDFNPLHVDPVAARRLQFGGTVCHGIQLLLTALDRLAGAGLADVRRLHEVQAVFQAPVLTGQEVELSWQATAGGLRLAARREGRTLFTGTLGFGEDRPPARAPEGPEHAPTAPDLRAFESVIATGDAATAGHLATTSPADSAALFPQLHRQAPHAQALAELMATTRLVGMVCPGLHSVYCGLRLVRRDALASSGPGLAWRATKADPRFRTVRLEVSGIAWQGSLDTLFRHAPVRQASLADVQARVRPGRFAGHRALVVGGSRGLGELAAKMLLAGGADVTLTYASGRADAEAVVADALRAGLPCRALPLDVSRPLRAEELQPLVQGAPTLAAYFATPLIARGQALQWNAGLFERYRRFYVDGLVELVQALVAGARPGDAALRVLNPSSVFVADPVKGFAEYAAAKAAGEVAATHLGMTGRVRVHSPRLARLRTDQNSDVADPAVADPYPALDEALQALLDAPR